MSKIIFHINIKVSPELQSVAPNAYYYGEVRPSILLGGCRVNGSCVDGCQGVYFESIDTLVFKPLKYTNYVTVDQ